MVHYQRSTIEDLLPHTISEQCVKWCAGAAPHHRFEHWPCCNWDCGGIMFIPNFLKISEVVQWGGAQHYGNLKSLLPPFILLLRHLTLIKYYILLQNFTLLHIKKLSSPFDFSFWSTKPPFLLVCIVLPHGVNKQKLYVNFTWLSFCWKVWFQVLKVASMKITLIVLMPEVTSTSETSVNLYQTIWRTFQKPPTCEKCICDISQF